MKKLFICLATIALTSSPFIGLGMISHSNLSAKKVHKAQKNNLSNKKESSSATSNLSGQKINHYFHQNTSFPNSIMIEEIKIYNNVFYIRTQKNGLWESTDNGATFHQNTSIPTTGEVKSISTYNNVVYVATDNGLYESTDNGATFHQNTSIPGNAYFTSIYAYNNVVYVGTWKNGLWESTDNGATFHQNTSLPVKAQTFEIYAYNNVVYVGTGGGAGDGLWESTDNGNNWHQNTSFSESTDPKRIYAYNNVVYVETMNDGTSFGNDGLWESTDNGQTFHQNTSIPDTTSNLISIYAYNNVVYVGTWKNGLWESTDNGQTFKQNTSIPTDAWVLSIYAYNNVIYVGTEYNGLWESKDNGQTFTRNSSLAPTTGSVYEIYAYNNVVYVVTEDNSNTGLYESNFNASSFSDFWNYQQQNNISENNPDGLTLFYNQNQNIILNNNPAVADGGYFINGKSITPGNHITLNDNNFQPNEIDIHLKNPSDASKYPLGNTSTGIVKVYFVIQDKLNQVPKYQTETSDTNLYSGLTSNKGNTNGWSIYQTSSPAPNAPLQVNLDSVDYLDFTKSYAVSGYIDPQNNFIATGTKSNLKENNNDFNSNGIYNLHLEDIFGNQYNSLLELGKSNWKATGSFDDAQFQQMEKELNVRESFTSPIDKEKLYTWLNSYQDFVQSQGANIFNQEKAKYGRGFDYSNLEKEWTSLKTLTSYLAKWPISVTDIEHLPSYQDNWNQNVVSQVTKDIDNALNQTNQNDWTAGVNKNKTLSSEENVSINTSQVQQDQNWSSDLNKYNQFLTDYKKYLDTNSKTIVDQEIAKYDLGYMTPDQQMQIENDVLQSISNGSMDLKTDYLNNLNWNTKTPDNSQEFQSLINMQAVDNEIQKDLNAETPSPKQQLQSDIANAEKGVNLYGFSVKQILQHYGKQLPQNKNQINNFDGKGTSFHNWLVQHALNFHNETQNTNQNKVNTNTLGIILGSVFGGLFVIGLFIFFFRRRIKEHFALKEKTRLKKELGINESEEN